MLQVKDTLRSTVQVSFDGRVLKTYHGPDAQTRFANEVRLLRHLEARGCGFVPKLLGSDPDKPQIITSNCGMRVQHLDEARTKELTYRQSDGRFCVIDFEFATILPGFE
jgi:hypothetical protein